MKFRSIAGLGGPNIWANFPVLEAVVELGHFEEYPSSKLPGFNERLTAWLPTLIEHRCSVGERGGFLKRLRDGTWLGHILEHVTLELQSLAGSPAGFGRAREIAGEYGVYKVVVSFEAEELARACLAQAHELIMAAIEDRPLDLPAELKRLRELADRVCFGPSTRSVIQAAQRRNIPYYRLNPGNLVQLGQGSRARRFWATETDQTTAIGSGIAQDKDLTRQLLRSVGVPVPSGRVVRSAEEAWKAALSLGVDAAIPPPSAGSAAPGKSVVVKPCDGNHGRGVSIDLRTQEQVVAAFNYAAKEGSSVIVEEFIAGSPHRILVVNGRVVAASRGGSEGVVGDGVRTVRELVQQANRDPLRRAEETSPLTPLTLDEIALALLERQSLSADGIPAQGQEVILHYNGDYVVDETDALHPKVVERICLAARMVGLDVAGVDVVAEDIGRPLEEQNGAVLEVNASPGLLMHLQPMAGAVRPVGEAILEGLFPSGSAPDSESDRGRIPLLAVAGTRHRAPVVAWLARCLAAPDLRLGVASEGQFTMGARPLSLADYAEPERVRCLLTSPFVDRIVTEVTATAVLEQGLGFDQASVALVTDYDPALGQPRELREPEETYYKALRAVLDVVPASGTAIVNADSPRADQMMSHSQGKLIYFSCTQGNPLLVAHAEQGGRTLALDGTALVLVDGGQEQASRVRRIPIPSQLRISTEVLLPVVAAGWGLGGNPEAFARSFLEIASNAGDDFGRGAVSGCAASWPD